MTSHSVPAWLPREIAQGLDVAELAKLPEIYARQLEAEADALGIYVAAYHREWSGPHEGRQLCTCIEAADIDLETIRRLNRLEVCLGVLLVGYARPLRLRV